MSVVNTGGGFSSKVQRRELRMSFRLSTILSVLLCVWNYHIITSRGRIPTHGQRLHFPRKCFLDISSCRLFMVEMIWKSSPPFTGVELWWWLPGDRTTKTIESVGKNCNFLILQPAENQATTTAQMPNRASVATNPTHDDHPYWSVVARSREQQPKQRAIYLRNSASVKIADIRIIYRRHKLIKIIRSIIGDGSSRC